MRCCQSVEWGRASFDSWLRQLFRSLCYLALSEKLSIYSTLAHCCKKQFCLCCQTVIRLLFLCVETVISQICTRVLPLRVVIAVWNKTVACSSFSVLLFYLLSYQFPTVPKWIHDTVSQSYTRWNIYQLTITVIHDHNSNGKWQRNAVSCQCDGTHSTVFVCHMYLQAHMWHFSSCLTMIYVKSCAHVVFLFSLVCSGGDPKHQLRGDGTQFSVSTSPTSGLQTMFCVPGQVLRVPLRCQLLWGLQGEKNLSDPFLNDAGLQELLVTSLFIEIGLGDKAWKSYHSFFQAILWYIIYKLFLEKSFKALHKC